MASPARAPSKRPPSPPQQPRPPQGERERRARQTLLPAHLVRGNSKAAPPSHEPPPRSAVPDFRVLGAWDDVKGKYSKLHELTAFMPQKVDGLLTQQVEGMFRDVPNHLKEVEATLEEARVRATASSAATRCGIEPEDPLYPRAVQLEARLAECTDRTVRLHKMCTAYHEELEQCRARVQALRAAQGPLAAAARRAMQRNRIVASAAEQLSLRDSSVPASDWLAELLPPPSRSAVRQSGKRQGASECSTRTPVTPLRPLTAADDSSLSLGARPNTTALPPAPASARATVGVCAATPSAPARSPRPATVSNPPSHPQGLVQGSTAAAPTSLWRIPATPSSAPSRPPSTRTDPLAATIAPTSSEAAAVSAEEQRYRSTIEDLEARLRELRRSTREMGAATAKGCTRTGQLEEFFLLCMHDFRQHAARQRSVAAAAASCHSARRRQDGTKREPFEKILKVMAESDELHMLLYEKLFPHRQAYFRTVEPISVLGIRTGAMSKGYSSSRGAQKSSSDSLAWEASHSSDPLTDLLGSVVEAEEAASESGRLVAAC